MISVQAYGNHANWMDQVICICRHTYHAYKLLANARIQLNFQCVPIQKNKVYFELLCVCVSLCDLYSDLTSISAIIFRNIWLSHSMCVIHIRYHLQSTHPLLLPHINSRTCCLTKIPSSFFSARNCSTHIPHWKKNMIRSLHLFYIECKVYCIERMVSTSTWIICVNETISKWGTRIWIRWHASQLKI